MFAAKNLFFDSGASGYTISRSVRLRSSASAYFNRTPASTTNRQVMTWSGWVKRGSLSDSGYMYLFGSYPGTSATDTINFVNGNLRIWFNGSTSADLVTTQVFRDPSAWYHIVVAIDTTQATAANRIKVYVNGSQVTAFSTATYPSQNYSTFWNNSSYSNQIGANGNGPASFFDGYLTEINFIDGQALTPSSFGATSTTTGVWGPAKYTGTYGTNGFYLNFSDNSAATAAAIGKDSSGNGNNWTPNNISVTAGVTYDSMVDTPTPYGSDTGVGGEVRGNYAVINPIYWISGNTQPTINDGNLKRTNVGGEGTDTEVVIATMPFPTTGKWYFEFTFSAVATTAPNRTQIGIQAQSQINIALGAGSGANKCFSYGADGQKVSNGSYAAYGSTYTTNDVIGVAVDLDNGALYFAKNNTWQNSGVPTSGASKTGAAYTSLVGTDNYFASVGWYASGNFNFGQRPFAYTAPTGFKALNTYNLPDSTIAQGNKQMDVSLYTGNGTSQSIVNSGAFQPDFVWTKGRSGVTNHSLVDSVRGSSLQLSSNQTIAEVSDATEITAFNSNGFSVGNSSGSGISTNANGTTYAGWQWKAGGAAVSNTSGSITSQVSANASAGFSVVTYTGTGANATVGHGLGVAPSMIITKVRSAAGADWGVYHTSLGNTQYLLLDTTAAAVSSVNFWNNTSPTSSVFSVGAGGTTNNSGNTMIAYCFAAIAGYSAFGSYTGNGSTDGPFVYLGFRPRWVLIRSTTAARDWLLYDTSRAPYNVPTEGPFQPNTSGTAYAGNYLNIDFLSNGFKIRDTVTNLNANGETMIYAVFAENPFKYSLAR